MKARVFRSTLLTAALLAASAPARAQDDHQQLAMRFRPLIKTTLDGTTDEPFHPASWRWFVTHADVYNLSQTGLNPLLPVDDVRQHPEHILSLPNADIVTTSAALPPNVFLPETDYGLRFYNTTDRGGEPWHDVIHAGDGVYAHVEEIPNTHQVNIEYTVLWTHNAAIGSNHDGDITTVTAVYDRDADLLVRLTYSIHGCAIESFRIAEPVTVGFRNLSGRGENGESISTPAAIVFVRPSDTSIKKVDLCVNGWNDSEAYVYLAQDPVSNLFEHVVIFAEEGSHEPWPNDTGTILTVPSHSGNGVSFLPETISMLGTVDSPNMDHAAFLFFNGKFGSDPQSIMLHRSWFWPGGRDSNKYKIPDKRFSDLDPYDSGSSLGWPPPPENTRGAEVLFADTRPVTDEVVAVVNNAALPFPGLLPALSFVKRNGVLTLNAGSYPVNTTIVRPMQIVARGGVVVIGTPRH